MLHNISSKNLRHKITRLALQLSFCPQPPEVSLYLPLRRLLRTFLPSYIFIGKEREDILLFFCSLIHSPDSTTISMHSCQVVTCPLVIALVSPKLAVNLLL